MKFICYNLVSNRCHDMCTETFCKGEAVIAVLLLVLDESLIVVVIVLIFVSLFLL